MGEGLFVDVGQGEGEGAGYGGCWGQGVRGGGFVELGYRGQEGRLDVPEGAVVVRVVCCCCCVVVVVGTVAVTVCHFGVVVVRDVLCAGAIVGRAVCSSGASLRWDGVEEFGALSV